MDKYKEIELLAPAKDKNTAVAAINAGADAVYIGYLKFGARKSAGNSLKDIQEIVSYADKFRVKVYVTINTVFTDEELNEVEKTINDLYKTGVSAIIIQDMGILNLNLPPVKIFASTQCHNDSLEKIKFLEKTGFDRVILPREFSLEEIKNITSNTNIDAETFVHGALCVSYSGQCYMSQAIGGRSANRGECAQPCRKKYTLTSNDGKIIAKDKYLLSLKDLNLSEKIKDLILSGVTSFKIEGRLKDELYVTNVVAYYRKIIDEILGNLKGYKKTSQGISSYNFQPDLTKSFNRGYTEFFIDGKRKNVCSLDYVKSIGEPIGKVISVSKTGFSIDCENTLNNGDGICFLNKNSELTGMSVQKIENGIIFPNSMNNIFKGAFVYRNSDLKFEKKVINRSVQRKLDISAKVRMSEKQLKLELIDEENNKSSTVLENDFQIAENEEKMLETIKKQISKTGNTDFNVTGVEVICDKVFFIKASDLNEIRRKTIQNLELLRKNNIKSKDRNHDFNVVEYPLKNLDYKANVYNKLAKKFYEERNAKVSEYAFEAQKNYDKKIIMTTKHCIKYTMGLCTKYFDKPARYKEPLLLIDEKGKKYTLSFDCSQCRMFIQN